MSSVSQQVQSVFVSAVTKSLSSPAGAKCLSVKTTRAAVSSYTEQPRESCTETQQYFNIATAQRLREAMQVSI